MSEIKLKRMHVYILERLRKFIRVNSNKTWRHLCIYIIPTDVWMYG